jgi:hypothetical protein
MKKVAELVKDLACVVLIFGVAVVAAIAEPIEEIVFRKKLHDSFYDDGFSDW